MVNKGSILEEWGENLLQEDFKAFLLTKTPLPNTPPKNQTSSERYLLSSITFPPGKNNRMLAKQPKTERGISVPPRHLAQLPVHMLDEYRAGLGEILFAASFTLSLQSYRPEGSSKCPQFNPYLGRRSKSACELCPWSCFSFSNTAEPWWRWIFIHSPWPGALFFFALP